jgi:hypothetical protein
MRILKTHGWAVVLLAVMVFAGASQASDQHGVSADVIASYPTPNVTQLSVNPDLLADRLYQRVSGAVDIYDAPGGNVIRTLDAGFNFLTTWRPEGEWTQVNAGEWVRTELLRPVRPSRFAGVLLGNPMPYPMAWVLVNVVPSRLPGAEPTQGDSPVSRYTKVNLYDAVEVEGWNWYQIGVNQWIEQRLIAQVLPVARPAGVNTDKWVSVDLYEQVIVAYEGEMPVFATLVSSGLAEWPTNEGLFNVYQRYTRTRMAGAFGQPDFYYLEEVPWTMYFDGDIGLHGTYWHDGFGYRHSHGCVNLSIHDAHWLFNWSADVTVSDAPDSLGMAVYVHSSGQYR